MSQINAGFTPHCEANLSPHQQHLVNHGLLSYDMPAATMPMTDIHYFQPASSVSRTVSQLLPISEQHDLPSSYSDIYSQGYGYPYGTGMPSSYIGNPPNPPPLIASPRQIIALEHAFQNEEMPNQSILSPSKPIFVKKPGKFTEVPSPQVANLKLTPTRKRKEFRSQEEFVRILAMKSPNNPVVKQELSILNANQPPAPPAPPAPQMHKPKNCDSFSTSKNESSSLMYPAHFMKGSIIQLAQGQLKRVEDMKTEDFIDCTKNSPNLKIDSSTVVRIVEKDNTALLSFSVGIQKIQVCLVISFGFSLIFYVLFVYVSIPIKLNLFVCLSILEHMY